MLVQVEINFGQGIGDDREALEDVAEMYLGTLYRAGQLCGENIRTWIGSEFVVTAKMAGLGAEKKASHSSWGLKHLRAVREKFGREPVWTIRDDEAPKRNITWKGASELVLFIHAFDDDSPVCRTDMDEQVPVFLLPVTDEVKEYLVRWQDLYVLHDRMWLASGKLEMGAYNELAKPDSELSKHGREMCREVEKATKVPTYYYLERYYSHPTEEFARRCPGCGGKWRTKAPEENRLRDWHFRCKRCRLVSNAGVEVNRRLARIGYKNL
jgi:predicted  nucleic acid-binding Zn ribbon protein